jgi:hypothetical protein
MSGLSIAFDILVTAAILWRQRRIRAVPPRLRLGLPVLLGLLGLLDLLNYTDHHRLSGAATGWLVGGLVLAAPLLGALRAVTVDIWRAEALFRWIVRRASWPTMALWLVTIAVHLAGASQVPTPASAGSLAGPSYLLFLAVTYGAQRAVEQVRAQRFAALSGPIDVESQPTGTASGAGDIREDRPPPQAIDVESEVLPPRPEEGP